MAYGNFVYTSDAGSDYSVTVPTDFATAIGMVPATSQPNLPATIIPRQAIATNTQGIRRSVVIQTVGVWNILPGETFVVSGVAWTFVSFIGESIPPMQLPVFDMVQGPPGATGPQGPQGPAGPGGDITTVKLTLSSAQILALHTTPVELVAAPGAGSVLVPVSAIAKKAYGGTQYTGSDGISIYWGTATLAMSLLSATDLNDANSHWNTSALPNKDLTSSIENTALNIYAPTGNSAAGNSTCEISLDYRTVTW